MKRRFELVGEGSRKFWEIDTGTGQASYGRIGCASPRRSNWNRYQVDSKIREKLKKGYVEVTDVDFSRVFSPGDLVKFRTDEPSHIKKWLGHSHGIKSVDKEAFGTVIDIEKRVPEAPHWNVYTVLADSEIRTCAGVYMKGDQRGIV